MTDEKIAFNLLKDKAHSTSDGNFVKMSDAVYAVSQALSQARQEGRESVVSEACIEDMKSSGKFWDMVRNKSNAYKQGYEACRKDAVEVVKNEYPFVDPHLSQALKEMKPKE